mgnify:CR=1 FL=1
MAKQVAEIATMKSQIQGLKDNRTTLQENQRKLKAELAAAESHNQELQSAMQAKLAEIERKQELAVADAQAKLSLSMSREQSLREHQEHDTSALRTDPVDTPTAEMSPVSESKRPEPEPS